ncbi:hypothetical protein [Paraclostridium bifermentans]|uniref:hypothetical protein n=1 Tax=Paraclostridium bifermentans TaxID=1490 RepID=UPI001C82577E|nr:hypothetical protein [Paraclostridium bifermentans]GIM32862.1 hypothetical protein PAGU1678_21320 [Paraclostridium bifermentans subsp. muricolitidis]
MKVQNINAIQYKNIYVKESDIYKFEDDEQKAEKSKSKEYNYNKNIAGQTKEELETKEDSNENQDKVTSEIVVNPSGMRTLLMLKNSKIFSSVNLGMSNGVCEELSTDEISNKSLTEQFNLHSELSK